MVAALVILAVGLLGIAAMQITSTRSNHFSHDMTQATILAQDKLEYLKNLSYNDSNLNHGIHDEGIVPGTLFTRFIEVAEDSGNSMKTITVTVRWTERGPHAVSFTTIRSK